MQKSKVSHQRSRKISRSADAKWKLRAGIRSHKLVIARRTHFRAGKRLKERGLKTLILWGLVLASLTFFAARAFGGGMAETRPSRRTPVAVVVGPGPLTDENFWALIDHSAALEATPEAQLADLRASLNRLSASQIADFERMFNETMRQSYSWDLWGAAYLANGGASDDGFEYFRCWLISKGRTVFHKVVASPDSLADLLAPGSAGDFEFEDFAYVAREAWQAKTGQDWNHMPSIANMAYDNKPSGAAFSEAPADLAKRYPKLWKRFGRE
jgi:hypothetical protein